MHNQQESDNISSVVKRDSPVELLKDLGFKLTAVMGWIAWIPVALFLTMIAAMIVHIFVRILIKIVGFIGLDITYIFAELITGIAALVLIVMGWFDIRPSIDVKKLNPWNVPWKIFMSILYLIKPNKFTFAFFFVTCGFLIVKILIPALQAAYG